MSAKLLNNIRLQGANELLVQLDQIARAFEVEASLKHLNFLIDRCIADFETAIEVTLSGYWAVAFDAMRDILEIQFFLMDFALCTAHVDEWLSADDRTLRRKFSPVEVRRRLKAADVGNLGEDAASIDYKGHSMGLHVRPNNMLVPTKGLSSPHPLHRDMGSWEIFEHSRTLFIAIAMFTHSVAPNSEADRLAGQDPPLVVSAWMEANKSQTLFRAIIRSEEKRRKRDLGAAAMELVRPLYDMGIITSDTIGRDAKNEEINAALLELGKGKSQAVKRALIALAFILQDQPVPPQLAGVLLSEADEAVDPTAEMTLQP
ncbi:hypothetical protein [Spongiactinospora gelatinilytica]|uniref:hypothetical protein n=1 Tax=Spongiactinospora gelatinilytica TaxID=2666298 RepID=UPI0011B94121|nr:hypothetical protein [Spongiactinospora gelatinilytica]